MTNSEKYDAAFMERLALAKDALNENLAFESVDTWDSVGHMSLIAAIEDAFNIMLETSDIMNFSSYDKGKEILSENYDVKF